MIFLQYNCYCKMFLGEFHKNVCNTNTSDFDILHNYIKQRIETEGYCEIKINSKTFFMTSADNIKNYLNRNYTNKMDIFREFSEYCKNLFLEKKSRNILSIYF